jgi:hypothetical protein
MNLSDSFYVALCMTVLILGVVYWFWTQNQYIQRKLNLLENIVYEMKSSMNYGAPDPIDKALSEHAASAVTEAAAEPLNFTVVDETEADIDAVLDSLTEAAAADAEAAPFRRAPTPEALAPVAETAVESAAESAVEADEVFEDLTPGGVGTGIDTDVSDIHNESVLNGMGLKELRELAKQKGVAGAKTLRKHELVAAIRESKTTVTPFEIREGTLELN